MVCLTIIGVLLTLVAPRYFHTIDRVEESVLRQNLLTTRDAIDKFFADKGRYPDRLDELVSGKYLRTLPYDPVTRSSESWILVAPDSSHAGKIFDLRSGAKLKTKDGLNASEL
ncbi:MAG: type II secretion system protein G [Burkholderiaceae bacterium]|nr:type II secretion system protein G [Burkholderiaceae bacterium]